MGILFLAAWVVYAPGTERPFHIMDFPETLPLLTGSASFGKRMEAFSAWYRAHGRFNPATFAAISLQWQAFEWWVTGWQLLRFAVMCGVMVVSYMILGRLGFPAIASWIATSAFVAAPSATRSFTILTTAEAPGTLCVLWAAFLALRLPECGERSRELWRALFVGVLLGIAVLVKEMLVAAVPFPYLLAWAASQRQDRRSDRVPPWLWRAVGIGIVCTAIVMVPIVHAFLNAPPSSYGARFGRSGPAAIEMTGSFLISVLPLIPAGNDFDTPALMLTIGYGLVLAIGLREWVRRTAEPWRAKCLALVALALPVSGTLAYALWPNYSMVYSLPFMFGACLALAMGMSGLLAVSRWALAGGISVWACVLAIATAQATQYARYLGSSQVTYGALARKLAEYADADSAFFVSREPANERKGSFAIEMRKYAAATGYAWSFGVREVGCSEVNALMSESVVAHRRLVVRRVGECAGRWDGALADSIQVYWRRPSWRPMGMVRDSLRYDLHITGTP